MDIFYYYQPSPDRLANKTNQTGEDCLICLAPCHLQLIGECQSLFLQHVQDAAVLLLYSFSFHQFQIGFMDFILEKSEGKETIKSCNELRMLPESLTLRTFLHDILHPLHLRVVGHHLFVLGHEHLYLLCLPPILKAQLVEFLPEVGHLEVQRLYGALASHVLEDERLHVRLLLD